MRRYNTRETIRENSPAINPVFSTEQAFFIAAAATAVMVLLTFLARTGQMDTHRIQDMHLLLSVDLGVFAEIAPAGHFCAHKPQEVQLELAFGIIPVSDFFVWSVAGN